MVKPTCSIADCGRPRIIRGWCRMHYQRWRTHGDPMYGRPSLAERFHASYSVAENGCWVWQRPLHSSGYAMFSVDSYPHWAHRVSYELMVGPIPSGLELDHLCRNPPCVNPAHLEPVTHLENVRRGATAQKTHCKNGHEFTAENTYHRPDNPTHRACLQCGIERRRRKVA